MLEFGDLIMQIFDIASIAKPMQAELDFLKEYVKFFSPVATLLVELQAEKNFFMMPFCRSSSK